MFTSEETATRAPAASGETSSRRSEARTVGIIEDRRRPGAPRSVLDPLYIARAIWNAKLLILATTVLGLGAAVLFGLVTPKLYVATAQILMDPRDIKVVANEVTPNGLPSEATLALIESQTSVIMSSNVLSRVIADANLDADPEFNGESKSGLVTLLPASLSQLFNEPDADLRDRDNRTLARLRHALTVGRETKSFVINLSVDSSDPEKAARLANLTANVFIDEQGRVQSDTAKRATTALSGRLSELRQSVVDAERAVEDYKSKNALIGVGGKLVDDEYITRINDQLAKARGDITALRVKADSMRRASVEDVVRGTLPEELSSEALVRLRQTYSDLAQQAAVLGTKLGPRHPQRIASEGALSASRQAISGELARIVAAAQTELARATETERNLTSQINELKDKQVETSGSFVKLRELEREVDASRAVYEAFLLRARETSEQESLNTANVRVISEATPPLQSSGMSRKIVVAAGGIVGFGAGVAIAALFAILRLLKAFFAGERRRNPDARWPDGGIAGPAGPGEGPLAPRSGAPMVVYDPMPRRAGPLPEMRPAVYDAGDELRRRTAARDDGDPGLSQERDARSERERRLAELDARLAGTATASEAAPSPSPSPSARLSAVEPSAPRQDGRAASGLASPDDPGAGPSSRPERDLSLADAARAGASRPSAERLSLRERVRALSDARTAAAEGGRPSDAGMDPEVAVLRDEIQTVKQAIADIRRRREQHSSGL